MRQLQQLIRSVRIACAVALGWAAITGADLVSAAQSLPTPDPGGRFDPPATAGNGAPMSTLVVDARGVSRNVLHVRLDMPIGDGSTRLVFPKWVPGQHAPANPVVDLALLSATAAGRPVRWQRDPVDLFAFTFAASPGATVLTLRYDVLLAPGTATSQLALIDWNPTLFYPNGSAVGADRVHASLLLPSGWRFATALDSPQMQADRISFAPVTIERLFDSPVLAGAALQTIPLTPDAELDVAADAPGGAVVNEAVRAHFVGLVNEAQALFGGHHWRSPYRFLVTASDAIGYTGLEHHESSWNGVDTDTLASPAATKRFAGDLLTHEFTHSWNGKFRRPAGLVRSDYQADETTDLLWVYEGLTEYYSDIFAARAGFWTPADYRAMLATKYAYLDVEGGRSTRSLADTTFQARLRAGRSAFAGARRASEEYYDEGELMWLDADTLIRERSRGRRSLDDFMRAFFGGVTTPPEVVPYTRADVVAALNAVLPNDWERFVTARLDVPTAHPPLDGITRGGYRVDFATKPADINPSARVGGDGGDWRFSVGARILPNGNVQDVVGGSPAAIAGLVPGATIVGVDARRYSAAGLTAAVERAQKQTVPIVLLVNNRQTFQTITLRYFGGIRLPLLLRVPQTPDIMSDIIRPRAARRNS